MKLSSLHTLVVGCFLGTSLLSYSTAAQKKDDKRFSPLCNRQSGLQLIQEQLPLTKTFADVASRIRVLLRAADLLWPYRNEESRAAFTEALDLAIQDHKEKGDGTRREGIGLMAEVPDQRYTVIAAIGKRDVAWARKLSDQMLDEDAKENNARDTSDRESSRRTNEKLLTLALGFLSSDETSAINYARVSLRYPASLMLPIFLFRMAELNRARADLFYEEALAAYAAKPMEQFLYLSAYPFANTRDVGEMPGWTIYRLPEGFNASPRLERLFVQRLLTNAQSILATPIEATATDNNDLSEAAQMWLALTRLESGAERVPPEIVVLEELVQNVVNDASYEAKPLHKEVRTTEMEHCRVRGSFELLRSGIENVVRNAIRYTAENTVVDVALSWRLDTAVLTVRDHGPGVPESELRHIFEPFYRVSEARERASGGVGLGLSIAERTVKLHGGTIRAENVEDGLRIIIELPLAPSPTAVQATPEKLQV